MPFHETQFLGETSLPNNMFLYETVSRGTLPLHYEKEMDARRRANASLAKV
jgi:hypothetical protein